MVDIAKLIKKGRARKKLKQRDLARCLGVVPSAVSQWESGKKIPGGDTLVALAQILDIVSELFPGYVREEAAVADSTNQSETCYGECSSVREELDQMRRDLDELRKLVKVSE